MLAALLERLPDRDDAAAGPVPPPCGTGSPAASRSAGASSSSTSSATIRAALPRDAIHAWDMTILAYCASAHFPALAPRRFLYPLGSGTLGYAWPAALGARLALPDTPALARRRRRRRSTTA